MKIIKNNEKSILLVGGGVLQAYSIPIARKKGLKIFLSDGNKNCYCRKYVDNFFEINTKDYKKTAALAKHLKNQFSLKSIYTQGTDVAFTVAYAAKKAGLYGLDPDIALATENKIIMRQKFAKHGMAHVKFMSIKKEQDLDECIKKIKFPMYIKPADNCASRGISRVTNIRELRKAYQYAKKFSLLNKDILAESEIKGKEYSVDTIIIDGKLYNAGISDRSFFKNEYYSIQDGSVTPSNLDENTQENMLKIMDKAAKILNINNSAFKGDLIIDKKDKKIKIIEVAARTSGGFDAQVRKPISFGTNIIGATIDLSLNNDVNMQDLIPKWIKWSKTFSIFPKPGIVNRINGIKWLNQTNYVVDTKIFTGKKQKINPIYNSGSRNNFITFKANDMNNLIERENIIRSKFMIVTK